MYIENTEICDVLIKHQVAGYFRYVDDILILHKETKTNIHDVLSAFNNVAPNMSFTLEKEIENKINILSLDIYRKSTATDTVIPNDSCNPREHKLAAIRCLSNRMTCNLNPINKQRKNNRSRQILHNNKHNVSILNNFNNTPQKKQKKTRHPESKMGKTYVHRQRNKVYYKTV
jgi:hypothetical protein